MTDEKLLRQYVADGSPGAFRQIVERYLKAVYATCLREVQNPEMAQDVTQVVFVLLAQKARRLRPGTVLPGWLFTTARFASKTALRQEKRRHHYETQAVAQLHGYTDQQEQIDANGIIEPWLNDALSSLKPADRDALLLRYAGEHTLREIGEQYGITEVGAHLRVARALEKLRRGLAKRGIDAPDTAALTRTLPILLAGSVLIVPSSLSAAAIVHAVPSIITGTVGATAAGAQLIQLTQGVNQAMRILQIKTTAVVLAGCAAIGIATATGVRWKHIAAVRYTITDLGTLPGYSRSGAAAINNRGEIVGNVSEGNGISGQPFYFRDSSISKISVPPGYNAYSALAITNQGTIIGDAFKVEPAGGFPYALIGTKDKLTLYTPPAPIKKIHFTGINNNGVITGMYLLDAANDRGTSVGFLLSDGKIETVPALTDVGFSGQAQLSINNQDEIVGGIMPDMNHPDQTFIYSGRKKMLLPPPAGYRTGMALAINDNGDITGELYKIGRSQENRAFLYRNGTATNLGTVPGFPNSMGRGINGAGVVVGSVIKGLGDPGDLSHAALFKDGRAIDLNTLVDPAAGWELSGASAINDAGQIVGSGLHNGVQRAFLLTPKS